ncbi:50S ribosomal protein L29 [Candidatus Marinamargulisbacteria bacterium SCGC AG-333-B06]|nr:50S ribosomal protein L29 [Candidatus Marinamargulisbacteria bacterium SCGC AG-333-B06]
MSQSKQINIEVIQEIQSKKSELSNIKLQIFLDKEKNKRLIKSKKKEIARLFTRINSQQRKDNDQK